MRASLLSLLTVLIVSPGALLAQNTPPLVVRGLHAQANALACPVHFSAERYGLAATMRKTAKEPADSFAQSLRINFASADAATILRMVVLVHGILPAAMAFPVGQYQAEQASSDKGRSEPFVLTRTSGRFDPAQQIVAQTIPLVDRIEITEIDFNDGRVWHASPESTCSIAPSPFVLVNATAQ